VVPACAGESNFPGVCWGQEATMTKDFFKGVFVLAETASDEELRIRLSLDSARSARGEEARGSRALAGEAAKACRRRVTVGA
jgi:hypothetical protein